MTKDDVKDSVRIIDLAQQAGYKLTKCGTNEYKCICPNPNHNDSRPSCSINDQKNIFQCMSCGEASGDVFNWVMLIEGCDFKSACEKLGVDEFEELPEKRPQRRAEAKSAPKATYVPPKAKEAPEGQKNSIQYKPEKKYITARYEYLDQAGNLKYQSIRYDYPDGTKSFMLVQRTTDGKDVGNMKGVTRIPFNYRTVIECDTIWFVEGEKCATIMNDTARIPTSCICGGSKAWIPEYAEYFRNKEMILVPDNDDVGRKFMEQVASDCYGIAKTIKIADFVTDDNGYKEKDDVFDVIENRGASPETYEWITEQALLAKYYANGVAIDGATPDQLMLKLKRRYEEWESGGLDLKEIFPEIPQEKKLRPLVGGDLFVINAATGAGKTSLVQNICFEYNEAPIPWFSLELSETKMHERNLILANEVDGDEVEQFIREGRCLATDKFDHIHIYDKARASLEYMEKQIKLMPLKAGKKAKLVVVDYIQLMAPTHHNMGPVQKIEENAYGLKSLAKETNTIIILLTQIGRKEEANLQASKGSGAIEESATLLWSLNFLDGFKDCRTITTGKNSNGDNDYSFTVGFEGRYFKFTHNSSVRIMNANMRDDDDDEEIPF